ncbi:hypothetical protein, partial [Thermomonospora catenispora]|uniref:hypothetical protein n=1 Tax=Thermomonospora catenispora TaxID=2493090 RepID=UPI001123DD28
MSDLFTSPLLWVEQPLRLPADKSDYKVLDGRGAVIAKGVEPGIGLGTQVIRAVDQILCSTDRRTDVPRRLVEVRDPNDAVLLKVESHVKKSATVLSPSGDRIGSFDLPRRGLTYKRWIINDHAGRQVGRLHSNASLRRVTVLDAYETPIAQIDKKWTG